MVTLTFKQFITHQVQNIVPNKYRYFYIYTYNNKLYYAYNSQPHDCISKNMWSYIRHVIKNSPKPSFKECKKLVNTEFLIKNGTEYYPNFKKCLEFQKSRRSQKYLYKSRPTRQSKRKPKTVLKQDSAKRHKQRQHIKRYGTDSIGQSPAKVRELKSWEKVNFDNVEPKIRYLSPKPKIWKNKSDQELFQM